MGRFVEEADRGQWTLLPECLDDFIDESNPVRMIDVFVDALDLAEMSFEGVEPAATGRPSYHPLGSPEALHLWLSEPSAVEPTARTRGRTQCRGHVAAGSARS
jgi:hypothetical protein